MMPIDFHGLGLSSLILKHSSESAMHSFPTTFYLEQEGNAARYVDPAFIPMTKWARRRPLSRPKGLQYIPYCCIAKVFHVIVRYEIVRLYDIELA